ncbi:MAG: helix-turn-helix transcriptional regulator [Armatimonadetes bacterium]|nr:helix-turn-helix transcriptional regulator [Armatimonadota bacterium]
MQTRDSNGEDGKKIVLIGLAGQVVRERREALGLSRDAIIQKIEALTGERLDKATLYRLEKGTFQPRESTLALIEKGLDLPEGLLSALSLPLYEMPDWVLKHEMWGFNKLFGDKQYGWHTFPCLIAQLAIDLMRHNDKEQIYLSATKIYDLAALIRAEIELPPPTPIEKPEEPVVYPEIFDGTSKRELEDDEILMGIGTLRGYIKGEIDEEKKQVAKSLLKKLSTEYQRRLSEDMAE